MIKSSSQQMILLRMKMEAILPLITQIKPSKNKITLLWETYAQTRTSSVARTLLSNKLEECSTILKVGIREWELLRPPRISQASKRPVQMISKLSSYSRLQPPLHSSSCLIHRVNILVLISIIRYSYHALWSLLNLEKGKFPLMKVYKDKAYLNLKLIKYRKRISIPGKPLSWTSIKFSISNKLRQLTI